MLKFISSYLETGNGDDSGVKPWFWILCMFLGPAGRALAFQWYIFIQKRNLVRAEALITQLVFEHSLRIRLNADASSEQKDTDIHRTETSLTVADTPENVSIASGSTENSETETTVVSGALHKFLTTSSSPEAQSQQSGKAQKQFTPPKADGGGNAKPDANLIGKIQNLVTTDLNNIVYGQDFLLLCTHHDHLANEMLSDLALLRSHLCPASSRPMCHVFVPNFRVEVRSLKEPTLTILTWNQCIRWACCHDCSCSIAWLRRQAAARYSKNTDEEGAITMH